MKTAIYYNDITKEITSVTDSDLSSEAGWTLLTDEADLRLLAVRAILAERNLVEDVTAVYWHLPQPTQAGGPALICDASEKKAGARMGQLCSRLLGNQHQQYQSSTAKRAA